MCFPDDFTQAARDFAEFEMATEEKDDSFDSFGEDDNTEDND